ncbi:acyltransferase family protein [Sphingomonas immobilis]|uniref:Acyltransferase family protein n=1 Tax=Sphingomonas immobilis TaxID=3063997 RepID=A0ABT8ZY17_9SPHN|nr:acyltransferase family protein [Sphingomonas sp. CA1-15]MDO7841671.1 acyltransferase family protein [Sphingomonas sp. CA1-15]
MTHTATASREHYWDATRALLMLLGIPFHAALAFQTGWWIVATHNHSIVLDYAAEAIHLFRMPAFFLVAGYFAAMLLARRAPGDWLRGRVMRLGVPLVAALLTLIPVLNIACELSNFAPGAALASFWNLSLTSGGYWVRHLWFLIVLLYLSGGAALAVRAVPSLRTLRLPVGADGWVARHPLAALLAVATLAGLFEAGAIETFYTAHLNTTIPQEILRLDDLLGALPWFGIGLVLQRSPQGREAFTRFDWRWTVLAVVAVAGSLMLFKTAPPPVYRFAGSIAALLVTQSIIAGARRAFDRPSAMVDRIVRRSFTIYLVHVPVIAWLALLADHWSLPAGPAFLFVTAAALAISAGLAALVERVALLRLLYGGTAPATSGKAPSPPPSRWPMPTGNYSLPATR